jgi:hypothetical protein
VNKPEASQLAARTGGGPYAVDVYCDDGSHRETSYRVTTFVIDPLDQPPMWDIYVDSRKWRRGHGQQLTKAHADARVVLRGDRRLTDDEISADTFADPDVRVRYRLLCGLCDRSVELRGEKLHPVLDQIALGGLPHIRLARLAAIVSN